MTIIYIIMCFASIALVRCASIAIALAYPHTIVFRQVYTDDTYYHIYSDCGYYDYYEEKHHATINGAEQTNKLCCYCVIRAAYHKYDNDMYIILFPLFFSYAFSIYNKIQQSITK